MPRRHRRETKSTCFFFIEHTQHEMRGKPLRMLHVADIKANCIDTTQNSCFNCVKKAYTKRRFFDFQSVLGDLISKSTFRFVNAPSSYYAINDAS